MPKIGKILRVIRRESWDGRTGTGVQTVIHRTFVCSVPKWVMYVFICCYNLLFKNPEHWMKNSRKLKLHFWSHLHVQVMCCLPKKTVLNLWSFFFSVKNRATIKQLDQSIQQSKMRIIFLNPWWNKEKDSSVYNITHTHSIRLNAPSLKAWVRPQ